MVGYTSYNRKRYLQLCLPFTLLISNYHRPSSHHVMTPLKFPRRYAQRQILALRHGRSTTPSKASSSHKRSQEHKPPYKKGPREAEVHSSAPLTIDPHPSSNSPSNNELESKYESDQDSGYSSSSSDTKAEYYRQMRAQFTADGPVMADLSEASKAIVKTEERKWNT
jgi:hypothetical protein